MQEDTCKRICQRSQKSGSIAKQPRSGRPYKVTPEMEQQLVSFVTANTANRRLAWDEIPSRLGWDCSGDTIKRVCQRLGYFKRLARRKFGISLKNQALRLQWCLEHRNWTYDDWFRVLWTDESSFSTQGLKFLSFSLIAHSLFK